MLMCVKPHVLLSRFFKVFDKRSSVSFKEIRKMRDFLEERQYACNFVHEFVVLTSGDWIDWTTSYYHNLFCEKDGISLSKNARRDYFSNEEYLDCIWFEGGTLSQIEEQKIRQKEVTNFIESQFLKMKEDRLIDASD